MALINCDDFNDSSDEFSGLSCFRQDVSISLFHPIGELDESEDDETEAAELTYFPANAGDPIDREWLESICPSVVFLQEGIRKALSQYCTRKWRVEILPEIEERLEDEELLRLRKDGLLPFVTITGIRFYRKSDRMIVDAACFIDFHLDEHGIAILKSGEEWIFGQGCDHDET